MADDSENKEAEAPKKKPRKKVPLILVGMVVQLLIVLGAMGLIVKGVFFTKSQDLNIDHLRERAIASVKDDSAKRKSMDLKEFTINLNKDHVLKTTIELEVSDADTVEIIERRMPAIKYKIINLLSGADAGRTGSFQGKLALKDSLREAINDELINSGHSAGIVREVYFTTFFLM